MTTSENDTELDRATAGGPTTATTVPAERRLDWRRLKGPGAELALAASTVAGIGQALGAVVAGRLAERPSWTLVVVLAACVVGAALLDTAGRTLWSIGVDRAEGRLRVDLLDAVMHQPVSALSEQAVGEVLDRVDDDTHELGSLLRQNAWAVIRVLLGGLPLLVVAGSTWWPAWILLPLAAVAVTLLIRPLLARLAERKVRRWPGPTTPPRWRRASPPGTTSAPRWGRRTWCAAAQSSPPTSMHGSMTSCSSRAASAAAPGCFCTPSSRALRWWAPCWSSPARSRRRRWSPCSW
jgi:hypothetical protein